MCKPTSEKMKKAGASARSRSDQDTSGGSLKCPLEENQWIEIKVVGLDGKPMADQAYVVTEPGGKEHKGKTTARGLARVEGLPKGNCVVTFPGLDGDSVDLTANVKPEKKTRPPKKKIPKKVEEDDTGKSSTPKVTSMAKPKPKPVLELLTCDEKFAPDEEKLKISYTIQGLSDAAVSMEVSCPALGGEVVYKYALQTGEKADGANKTLEKWDGKCDQGTKLNGHFLNPLFSPYRVKLKTDTLSSSEKEVAVLYHSLQLKAGPWMPPDDVPDFNADVKPLLTNPVDAGKVVDLSGKAKAIKWLQLKLNEQGYFAGKIDGDLSSADLKKAVRRYNCANLSKGKAGFEAEFKDGAYKVKKSLLDEAGASFNKVTEGLLDALNSETHKRDVLDLSVFTNAGGTPAKVRAELDVEAHRFYVTGDEHSPTNSATNSAIKNNLEGDRLSRPWFPVRAKVLIQGRGGGAKDAPGAVGPVGVKWTWADEKPDMSHLLTDPNTKTKKYIENALKALKPGSSYPYDNVQAAAGGLLAGDDTDRHEPFTDLPEFPKDVDGDEYLFSRAYDDASKNVDLLGTACVAFRPSTIGGDNYKITAAVVIEDDSTFKWADKNNKGAFEAAHQGVSAALSKSSGKIEVWRTVKVSAYVKWFPGNDKIPSTEWDKVKKEYKAAFVKMEVPSSATALTTALKGAIKGKLKDNDGNTMLTGSSASAISGDVMAPRIPLPDAAPAKHYAEKKKLYDIVRVLQGKYFKALAELLNAEYPGGVCLVNWCGHKKFNNGSRPKYDTAQWRDYIAAGDSFGGPNGVAFVDHGALSQYAPYHLVAHEIGHTMFLEHWKNTAPIEDAHDKKDDNCIMSYLHLLADFDAAIKQPRFNGSKADIKIKGVNPGGFNTYYYYRDLTVELSTTTSERGWNQSQTLTGVKGVYKFDSSGFNRKQDTGFLPAKGTLKISSPEGITRTITWQSDDNNKPDYVNKVWPTSADPPVPFDEKPAISRGNGDHYQPGRYKPHFCGKCNLKLRGWDITGTGMPEDSD